MVRFSAARNLFFAARKKITAARKKIIAAIIFAILLGL